jgi:hypothetical protein
MKHSVKTVIGNIVLSREICNHGGGSQGSHFVYNLLDPFPDLRICVRRVVCDGG